MTDQAGSANTAVALPELSLSDLNATIAAELAAGLSSAETIRKRFGLTVPQWKALTTNHVFRSMVRDALKAFQGDLNAGKRITLKAEVMLEDSLEVLYGLAKATDVPSGERIKAVQTMADLAGRNAKTAPDTGPKQAGFTLNINVGSDKPVIITADPNGNREL